VASQERTDRLDDLVTEGRLPQGSDYDRLSTEDLVALMNRQDAVVHAAVGTVGAELAAAIDAIVARLRAGGRLVYVGAGTSGRLAELDAAECESTFGTDQVVAIAAGARLATSARRDEIEDDAAAGADAVRALGLSAADAVVAVSASGGTPFVVGAFEAAVAVGALTVAAVSVEGSELGPPADPQPSVVLRAGDG